MKQPPYTKPEIIELITFRKWCIEQANAGKPIKHLDGSDLLGRASAIGDWAIDGTLPEPPKPKQWKYGPTMVAHSIPFFKENMDRLLAKIDADGGEVVGIYVRTTVVKKGLNRELLYDKIPTTIEEEEADVEHDKSNAIIRD